MRIVQDGCQKLALAVIADAAKEWVATKGRSHAAYNFLTGNAEFVEISAFWFHAAGMLIINMSRRELYYKCKAAYADTIGRKKKTNKNKDNNENNNS